MCWVLCVCGCVCVCFAVFVWENAAIGAAAPRARSAARAALLAGGSPSARQTPKPTKQTHTKTHTHINNAQQQQHDWLVREGAARDAALDSVVLTRMRHFAQLNKLKKMALMVVGQSLAPDELAGARGLALWGRGAGARFVYVCVAGVARLGRAWRRGGKQGQHSTLHKQNNAKKTTPKQHPKSNPKQHQSKTT